MKFTRKLFKVVVLVAGVNFSLIASGSHHEIQYRTLLLGDLKWKPIPLELRKHYNLISYSQDSLNYSFETVSSGEKTVSSLQKSIRVGEMDLHIAKSTKQLALKIHDAEEDGGDLLKGIHNYLQHEIDAIRDTLKRLLMEQPKSDRVIDTKDQDNVVHLVSKKNALEQDLTLLNQLEINEAVCLDLWQDATSGYTLVLIDKQRVEIEQFKEFKIPRVVFFQISAKIVELIKRNFAY